MPWFSVLENIIGSRWPTAVETLEPPYSCVSRPNRLIAVLQDASGLDATRRWNITQVASHLPAHIPHLHNGSGRTKPLTARWVALTTFDLISPGSKRVFSDPYDLRRHFQVCTDAQVLLLSIGKDNCLEQYWRWSAVRDFARYLAALGVAHITAPNFSYPLDVPRTEHLVNRVRSLKCAEQFSAAGLSVVPHLNAFNQRDWDCWQEFMRDHTDISLVAQEFQTGLATPKRASWHIRQLRNMEQSLGRGLHLVAVGGRRHLPLLVGLSRLTVIDSVPFIRACMRRLLNHDSGKWVISLTPAGDPIDDLLEANVRAYHAAIMSHACALRHLGPKVPERKGMTSNEFAVFAPKLLPDFHGQLEFWPTPPERPQNGVTGPH